MAHTFTITVDGESLDFSQHTATVRQILTAAELDPEKHYLVEWHGSQQVPHKALDEELHLHEKAAFVSVFKGATPVAYATPQGAARFAAGLQELGYEVAELPDGHLWFRYTVEVGKFAGTTVDIGLVIPDDFPINVPHGPHVRPHIHEVGKKGEHPTGGIHPSPKHSKHFGSDWQHWSRPYKQWSQSNRDVAVYMSFLRQLWATQ